MAGTFLQVNNGALARMLADILANGFGNGGPGDPSIGLYTSPYAPAPADTIATYAAIEAAWSGYARALAPLVGWTGPTIIGNGAYVLGVSTTWTRGLVAGGPATVYGYFVVTASGDLAWAQELPAPIPVNNPGDSFPLTPQYSYLSQH